MIFGFFFVYVFCVDKGSIGPCFVFFWFCSKLTFITCYGYDYLFFFKKNKHNLDKIPTFLFFSFYK